MNQLAEGHDFFDVAYTSPSRNHRYLAYAELDGNDVNLKMVEAGMLMVYTEFSFAREAQYLEAEQKARAKKTNIWLGAKSTKLIRGLRKQWGEFRKSRGGSAVKDVLLK